METLIDYENFVSDLLLQFVEQKAIDDVPFLLKELNQFAIQTKREKVQFCRALLEDKLDTFVPHLLPDYFLLLDSDEKSVQGMTFDLPYFIEMMGLIYLFGLRAKNERLLEIAIKMAYASLQLLNRHDQLAVGIAASDHFDREAMLATHASVMRSMARLGSYPSFEGIGAYHGSTPLSVAIDQAEEPLPLVAPSTKMMPIYNLSDSASSLIIDSFGYRTPWGYFELSDVEVRAFGIGGGPLGEMGQFGTDRMVDLEAEDHTLVEEGERSSLSGWTRLIDRSTFAHLNIVKEGAQLNLEVRLAENDVGQKKFMQFFVKATHCEIEGEGRYELRSLHKYRGNVKKVTFGQGVVFEANLGGEMELIPLEGEGHFYGADFMLVYELGELDGLFKWKIGN